MTTTGRRTTTRFLMALPAALVAGCLVFPAPTPPVPLTKSEVGALAKCQKTVKSAQSSFIKTKLAALESCVDGVLNARLSFENGLTTSAEFDAAIGKMRGKCTKSYAKIGAASTKLVDAVLKACTPVADAVLGPYDALRFQSAYASVGHAPATLVDLAGTLCTLTDEAADSALWQAAPRLMELLQYLGPEFTQFFDASSGLPNVPLDARCLPLSGAPGVPTPTPTSTPP